MIEASLAALMILTIPFGMIAGFLCFSAFCGAIKALFEGEWIISLGCLAACAVFFLAFAAWISLL